MPRSFPAALLTISLKPSLQVPLYQQLFTQLRELIVNNELRAGTRLPASRQLVKSLSCSRSTVVMVFEMLGAEGYVETRQGSGTYVTSVLPDDVINCRPDAEPEVRLQAQPRLSDLARRMVDSPVVDSLLPHSRVIFPDVREFPYDLWSRLYRSAWKEPAKQILSSSETLGYFPLRQAICSHLRDLRGLICTPEQIAITSGASHGMSLLFQMLLNPGDKVWIEDPSPPWVRAKLAMCNARPVFVPVDNEGMDIPHGRQVAADARLALVTPSHQCPLGSVLSHRRRASLLEWAEASDSWIVEDDYDSEFRYTGRPLPTLYSMDRRSRVFYLATFSKVILPSLRLGFIVIPEQFVDAFARVRALMDRYTATPLQPVLAAFINDGHFASHLRRTRLVYESRQDVLLSTAETHLNGLIRFQPSEAGIHSLGQLSERLLLVMDATEVSQLANSVGLGLSPMSNYCHEVRNSDTVILGYAQYSGGELIYRLRRLADILNERITKASPARTNIHSSGRQQGSIDIHSA